MSEPFYFRVSKHKGKKYDAVFRDGHVVSFGAKGYQQYKDQTGLYAYSGWDHDDQKRRKLYYDRHGSLGSSIPYSADWFSKVYLW